MAKSKTPEELLKQYSAEILRSIERYKSIIEHGCSDPTWPDGCNANLCRNHVLAYKRYILDICADNDLEIPTEIPTIDEHRLSSILWEAGVSQDKLEKLHGVYENAMHGKVFRAVNLVEDKVTISGMGFKMTVDNYHKGDVSTAIGKVIFGVADTAVDVNGIGIKMDGVAR